MIQEKWLVQLETVIQVHFPEKDMLWCIFPELHTFTWDILIKVYSDVISLTYPRVEVN